MKAAIVLGISAAMIVGGLYLVVVELFWAPVMDIKFVIAGAATAALGGHTFVETLGKGGSIL